MLYFHSPFSEQNTPLKAQLPDSAEGPERAEHHEPSSSDCAEETHEQHKHQELSLQPEAERRSADGSSASPAISSSHLASPISPSASSAPSPISPPGQVVEGKGCFPSTFMFIFFFVKFIQKACRAVAVKSITAIWTILAI